MKTLKFIFTISIIALLFLSCSRQNWTTPMAATNAETILATQEPQNTAHPKGIELQAIMDGYTKKGLSGIAIAIYSEQGYWAGASGFAKIEDQTKMLPSHLQYSQSVAKTYMAVAILKLCEQGKLNLDEKITSYLPKEIAAKITNADKITVRMLLNHTSGIAEYNSVASYVSYLLQHPLHQFAATDYVNYIANKPLDFAPASKHSYRNTNYLLLALIADFVTGNHTKFMYDEIFKPLNLQQTFYHEENFLNNTNLVNSYWDRYSNGVLENCSQMQQTNVASLIGDDGIIATPIDYVRFMKALFDGKIISANSLKEMLTFVGTNTKNDYGYGLGISKNTYKQQLYYRHSGGGIGAGCQLVYFPKQKIYFFVAINMGTIIDSPIFDDFQAIQDSMYDVLVK